MGACWWTAALTNNVPADVARAMGAEVVIAVDVGNPEFEPLTEETAARRIFLPGLARLSPLFGAMIRSVSIMQAEILRHRLALARPDLVIRPTIGPINIEEFERAAEVIPAGSGPPSSPCRVRQLMRKRLFWGVAEAAPRPVPHTSALTCWLATTRSGAEAAPLPIRRCGDRHSRLAKPAGTRLRQLEPVRDGRRDRAPSASLDELAGGRPTCAPRVDGNGKKVYYGTRHGAIHTRSIRMTTPDWAAGFPGDITVCDAEGVILYLNDRSAAGIRQGRWPRPHRQEPAGLPPGALPHPGEGAAGLHNASTPTPSRRRASTKLIYQTPWYKDGVFAGLVEMSLEIPADMPHFVRKG